MFTGSSDFGLTSIDLFCGAGGLSLGLERAGFISVMGLDTNRDAMATYRDAFPNAETVERSVAGYDFRQWRGVDLVAGGPPCQPFSNGGKRLAAKDDRVMIPEFARAVNEITPRAFIMENVAGLLAPRNREYMGEILALFSDRYTILPPRLVNAADYGVPQKRFRIVLIGLLKDGIDFPAPTHLPGRHVAAGSVLRRGKQRVSRTRPRSSTRRSLTCATARSTINCSTAADALSISISPLRPSLPLLEAIRHTSSTNSTRCRLITSTCGTVASRAAANSMAGGA